MRARWPEVLLAAVSLPLAWSCGDPFKAGGSESSSSCDRDSHCDHLDEGCQEGRCIDHACEAREAADGESCDDGLICTQGETCWNGACGTPVDCPQPQDSCQRAVCQEQHGGCVDEPAHEGSACDDDDPCTAGDVCVSGACRAELVTACVADDGCCPEVCTSANDGDCACLVNHALQASASSSQGGANPTPERMNDGLGQAETCQSHWISNNTVPVGAYIQLDWPQDVSLASLYVDTEHATSPSGCAAQPGRNLADGEVQAWIGGAWSTLATFHSQTDDVQIDLPLTTTSTLRIFNATSGPGNGNTMIYEWYVYADPGCVPSPPAQ
jgi:hypothetical protein